MIMLPGHKRGRATVRMMSHLTNLSDGLNEHGMHMHMIDSRKRKKEYGWTIVMLEVFTQAGRLLYVLSLATVSVYVATVYACSIPIFVAYI